MWYRLKPAWNLLFRWVVFVMPRCPGVSVGRRSDICLRVVLDRLEGRCGWWQQAWHLISTTSLAFEQVDTLLSNEEVDMFPPGWL